MTIFRLLVSCMELEAIGQYCAKRSAVIQLRILTFLTNFIFGTGKKHGITDVHPDVVNFVSHATQQRLQTLVEKISEVAQQRNITYKVSVESLSWFCQMQSYFKNTSPLSLILIIQCYSMHITSPPVPFIMLHQTSNHC